MKLTAKKLSSLVVGMALPVLSSTALQAAELTVEVENLTRGTFFTPLAVAAHPADTSLFELGGTASTGIQAMAEGGSLTDIETTLTSLGATMSNNPAAGLLSPGASTMTTLNTDGTDNVQLSIVGMILPTNDGFVALNAIDIPTAAGTYTYYARAYDAGTEANDEMRGSGAPGEAGFPVPGPLDSAIGNGGTGVNAEAEGYIHVHRGVLGDTDASGGLSDIDSTMHRWLNPIAKITLTVAE